MKNKKNIFFKVPKHQVEVSDYFVFCIDTSEYYLVPKESILNRFKFKTKEKNANIRITTIRNLAIHHSYNVNDIKIIIDKIEV